ncbi:hypothetical protein HMPREF9021_02700 [Simonsiella muelleri ATCC 29453]|uniref:Uncharacterized protein n=1 Tax=Simonsiella muelleri ATCC 29453 TaxID=641147 RepID=U6Q3B3_9NEIS|nr:hypothetical protein HMPREF9021_01988 [Simonsiella muelleri ATCC 29453]EJZ50056.1 hypothetical protein HMPREF9021_02700 [Simonsiella muelleri ATCC 29453]
MEQVITFQLNVWQLVGLAFLFGILVCLTVTLVAYKFNLIKLCKDLM